jgi:hypothetical protein
VPADYDGDGDGDDDIAVFRPNGIWFVLGGPTVAFGTSGDIPCPATTTGTATPTTAPARRGLRAIPPPTTESLATAAARRGRRDSTNSP